MKKQFVKIYTLLLCSLAMLSSCRDLGHGNEGGEGYLSLNLNTQAQDSLVSLPTKADQNTIYKVEIVKPDGQIVKTFDDHTQLNNRIKILAGNYTVQAINGDSTTCEFDKPCYFGQTKANVQAGGESDIVVKTKLYNVVTSMVLDQKIVDNFTKSTLLLFTSEGEQLFQISKEQQGRLAYLKPIKALKWKLMLTNIQGEPYMLEGEIADVAVQNRYDFKFSVNDPTGEDIGLGKFDITIDRNLQEFSHTLGVAVDAGPAPVVSAQGNFMLGQPIVVNQLKRDNNVQLNVESIEGIKQVWFYHQIPAFDEAGIPRGLQLTNATQEMRDKLLALGVEWSPLLFEQNNIYINFTNFCKTAPLGEFYMRVTFEDAVSQYVAQDMDILVLPDQDHMALSVDSWAKFADFKAQWYTVERPTNLTIEYKADGDAEWTKCPTDRITYDDANKVYSLRVNGLRAQTNYTYRTVSDAKAGKEFTFQTEAAIDLPNPGFQTWSYGNSAGGLMGRVDTWYPNVVASNYDSFWATGNEGTSMTQAASRNITYPDTDPVHGKVVKMESIWINATFAKTFAAGNIFSGYFSVNTGDPIKSAKFGRPYQSRPLGLKGRYKYKSTTINRNAGGGDFNKYLNTPDKGAIYIKLENWGDPNIKPESFGSGNQPNATKNPVAYGGVDVDDTGGEWVEFTFPVNYSTTTLKPTHVTIAASSSKYGDNFCGGEGATLWISGLELIWE